MHDGASAHYSAIVRRYLTEKYGERWIGRGGPIAWPPRSPDLNPLDFFFWGYLKDFVYSREITSREHLWARINLGCNLIRNNIEMFEDVQNNFKKRIEKCIDQSGGHFEQLL